MSITDARHAGAVVGFEAQPETLEPRELEVEGEMPGWLTGSLLRNGPGDWHAGKDSLRHWFDGLAMLHAFTFDAGRVHYRSRYLDSSARRRAQETGALQTREFATDPCRSIFQRVHSLFDSEGSLTDNANVSVQRLGDRLIAMTETPMPVVFDAATLQRIGVAYQAPGQITTAHPHYERGSGALLNYAAHLGLRSSYRFFRVAPGDGEPEEIARIPVREPAYMHSFGITEHFFVLSEFPLVVNPLRLAMSGEPFISNYAWKPERGTRFTLVDRATGAVRARLRGEPCFGFHHINAFEREDGTFVVDLSVATDAELIEELFLDRIRGRLEYPDRGFLRYPVPTRFELDPAAGTVKSTALHDKAFELPVVNHRRVRERPYSTAWGVGSDDTWLDRIIRLDMSTGETRTWREPGAYPGEPIFVERPGARAEDDGVLLCVVLNAEQATSSLVILDASTLEPIARANVGQPVPYGFHGMHIS